MVKIDSVILSSVEKKLLITHQCCPNLELNHSHNNEPDNRYRVVDPLGLNKQERCSFFVLRLILKYPVISSLVFTLSFFTIILYPSHFNQYVTCLLFKDDMERATYYEVKVKACTLDGPIRSSFDPTFSWNKCKNIPVHERFDCLPENNYSWQSQFQCYFKGCCWATTADGYSLWPLQPPHGPFCYYPPYFKSYEFINGSASNIGYVAFFGLVTNSTYPNDIPTIKVELNYRTEDILEVKISDPTNPRYETPFPVLPPLSESPARNTKYSIEVSKDSFGFRVIRKSNNKTIFDTQNVGGLIFADQLLQISAKLPSKYLYGLGQQRNDFLLDMNWKKITLFNHDQHPVDGSNLYGSHPFYVAMEEGGLSNGVLLLNSNAMDILLSPAPAITYQTIGGVLDFFFFLGPSPAEVIQQYTELVGRPFLPPYWSLGFHLCRFGYKTLNETMAVWNRTRNAGIPFDTQWNDLDYMENGNDFTYNNNTFQGLPEFVDILHKEGMHYMVLIDPGVSAGELPGQYPPYDDGIAQSAFVTDSTGYRPLVGKVWNRKATVFVDFFKPATVNYWMEQLRSLHNLIPFDGAWIDMNDPSNFVDGSLEGCGNSSLDNPPYVPAVAGGRLCHRTLSMSARHNGGALNHYDVHNVYGLAEAIVTSFSMQQIRGKRPFVISRSSFPGHGKYAGVWTGDISSTWDDMAHSVSDILSFSLFGIPMAGADICGFNGNATAALCELWSQLGAFYPFARNHNSDLSSDQDPVAMGPEVVRSASRALSIRYTFLPYLYTLFWHAHSRGDTVARPMFVEFPEDTNTYTLNAQFMWGPALLIVPVLKENAEEVDAYLPAGRWYNAYWGDGMNVTAGTTVTLRDRFVPLDTAPLLMRGGYVIPLQFPDTTTTKSRLNGMALSISLDEVGQAKGDLYWDDGDTLAHYDGIYNYLKFTVNAGKLSSEVVQWRFMTSLTLDLVEIFGVENPVSQVLVYNESVNFSYDANFKVKRAIPSNKTPLRTSPRPGLQSSTDSKTRLPPPPPVSSCRR